MTNREINLRLKLKDNRLDALIEAARSRDFKTTQELKELWLWTLDNKTINAVDSLLKARGLIY